MEAPSVIRFDLCLAKNPQISTWGWEETLNTIPLVHFSELKEDVRKK